MDVSLSNNITLLLKKIKFKISPKIIVLIPRYYDDIKNKLNEALDKMKHLKTYYLYDPIHQELLNPLFPINKNE